MAMITYLKLEHDVLLGHLDWGLGTKGPRNGRTDKTFLGLRIASNIPKWSNLLLKIG